MPRRAFREFIGTITAHPLSMVGTYVTTVSAILFLCLMGMHSGPYAGILIFILLPGVFVFGLVLIPVGIFRRRRQLREARKTGGAEPPLPVIDLNSPRIQRLALLFVAATAVNVIILAVAAQKSFEFSESVEFCGKTCHTVMIPEYTAYSRSPHARVRCAQCHIGEGAGWMVKYKIDGVRQLVAVTLNTYSRPIPTPVHNLRPARDTCESCHWPTHFTGAKLKVFPHFADDQANTPRWTVLGLRVGGRLGDRSHGIHWHVDPGVLIRYRSDESRLKIYDVEVTRPEGGTKLFKAPAGAGQPEGAAPEEGEGKAGEWRTMDCIDCHNRPTHVYMPAEHEVDIALASGRIDTALPFIRREGLKAIKAAYGSNEEAEEGIRRTVEGFYASSFPQTLEGSRGALDGAIAELTAIWKRNVYPSMNITWGTYPDHIGHEHAPGCFRCHNGEHSAEDGSVISQECETCHSILAMEEENPAILEQVAPNLFKRSE